MATDNSADIINLHQPRRALSPAERARRYRQRKKAGVTLVTTEVSASVPAVVKPQPLPVHHVTDVTPVTKPSRRPMAAHLLGAAALALAVVGCSMNAWYSRSLGSSDISGWLFLAVGVAADAVALATPTLAALAWQRRQRATAAVGWGIWSMTFLFAVMSGIGFAALNISDVTASRASRVTPAVTVARDALADAMASRDKECRGGVGKFCREREAAVADRRAALDGAMATVAQSRDPQTDAAIRLVAWISHGMVQPTENDFAMLRLILLSLLPQIGGVLLMLRRTTA
jgi:hypothetical protein